MAQLTGRKNYARAQVALGIQLVEHPELAALPEHAGAIAAWFWREHNLNRFGDAGDVRGCTLVVNGGLNGLAQRETYYSRAIAALLTANV
jgi:putative chitinase